MKRFLYIFLIFIFVSSFYLFFRPLKIYKKDIFVIDKIFAIDNIFSMNAKHDGYFVSDNECGYFIMEKGMLHYKKGIEDEFIQANSNFYIIYKKVGDKVEIYSPKGQLISTINTFGYPYIINERPIFAIIKTNGMGFSLYNINGNILIGEKNFTSIISSISTDENNNVLVSTIDGKTYFYSNKGELVFENYCEDTKIIITKSSTVNNNGEELAICSGLYPEYIEIFKLDNLKKIRRIAKYNTKTNFRYKIFMRFFDNRLYYEGINNMNYYDLSRKKNGSFKIKGFINEIDFNDNGDILIVTSHNDINYITMYSYKGKIKYYKEYNEKISNIKFINTDSFYFRISDRIMKINFKEIT